MCNALQERNISRTVPGSQNPLIFLVHSSLILRMNFHEIPKTEAFSCCCSKHCMAPKERPPTPSASASTSPNEKVQLASAIVEDNSSQKISVNDDGLAGGSSSTSSSSVSSSSTAPRKLDIESQTDMTGGGESVLLKANASLAADGSNYKWRHRFTLIGAFLLVFP